MSSTLHTLPIDLPDVVSVNLPGSKSIANRLLILKALSHGEILLQKLGESNDVRVLEKILFSEESRVNVEDAGTAARFGLAWSCLQGRVIEMHGSERMHQRPVAPLIEALRHLGFKIECLQKDGFFPVRVTPVNLQHIQSEVSIVASISSQYTSALALIAPFLTHGLTLNIVGDKSSWPYVEMTLNLLRSFGVVVIEQDSRIKIAAAPNLAGDARVELDWSAAAFWYELACVFPNQKFDLGPLTEHSIQGDMVVQDLYKSLGVESSWEGKNLIIQKSKQHQEAVQVNFKDCPDLAQAFICSCALLNVEGSFSGLQTLKHKESNRLMDLSAELEKFGIRLEIIADDQAKLHRHQLKAPKTEISSHMDHRMAMSLAPFAFVFPFDLDNSKVIAKSYPNFWLELEKLGLHLRHEDSGH